MTNISEIRRRLSRMCNGTYSHDDVDYIVDIFHTECEKYIESHLFAPRNSGTAENYRKTVSNYAYDFIGSFLGRDPGGKFHILDDYFSNFRETDDAEFMIVFKKFLFTHFHSELIRLIEEDNGFSKAFRRTTSYILKKHTDWIKTEPAGKGITVKAAGHEPPYATFDDFYTAYAGIHETVFSKYIERGLIKLLDQMERQVCLRDLRRYLIEKMEYIDFSTQDIAGPEPDLELTKTIILKQTVKEIDDLILNKYVRHGKLTEIERQAFFKSIELLLFEWITYLNVRNYADYLSQYLPKKISVEEYRRKYRALFEYAVREAKKLFSAKMKNIINK